MPLFADDTRVEHFEVDSRRKWIVRTVAAGGVSHRTRVPLVESCSAPDDLGGTYDASWLRARELPPAPASTERVRIVDVFSGCGGLSVGVAEACRALGFTLEHALAIDSNRNALQVLAENFPDGALMQDDVNEVFDGELGDALTSQEKKVVRAVGSVDFLVGGPPCQGHSDLNNHTRRRDPRNSLYFRMARFAEVLRPRYVIVENVPGAVHDRTQVVQRTSRALEELGYRVDSRVLHALELGVPQRRRRHFLVASRSRRIALGDVEHLFGTEPRTFQWACGDLAEVQSTEIFDTAAIPKPDMQARIDYLFDHGLYDLPDEQRTQCHRNKSHSYKSVYGRLSLTDPVPTITRGFRCPGQGRFVHPTQRRTLTPHEAARLQYFPDFFSFRSAGKFALKLMIGNAVPSKLSYVIALQLLRGDIDG